MDVSYLDRTACAERRSRLARCLGNHGALVAAGAPRPRGTHRGLLPFRAASHFLYLFGLHLPKAMGLWTGERWQLYLPEPAPEAALWTGPEPSLSELGETLGLPVLPLTALPEALVGKAFATLAAPDVETCLEQSSLLGREIRPGKLPGADELLADSLIAMRLVHDASAIVGLRQAAAATAAAAGGASSESSSQPELTAAPRPGRCRGRAP